MPVDIDVKVVVDENGATKITFNKKALMEAPLSQLIRRHVDIRPGLPN